MTEDREGTRTTSGPESRATEYPSFPFDSGFGIPGRGLGSGNRFAQGLRNGGIGAEQGLAGSVCVALAE